MLVVMQSHATSGQVNRVLETILAMGLTPHAMPGPTRTAICITGNTSEVDSRPARSAARRPRADSRHQALQARQPRDACARYRDHDAERQDRRLPVHDHGRPVLGRRRADDPAHGRVAHGSRREVLAGRRLQAADKPVRLSGPGPERSGDPRAGCGKKRASPSSPS